MDTLFIKGGSPLRTALPPQGSGSAGQITLPLHIGKSLPDHKGLSGFCRRFCQQGGQQRQPGLNRLASQSTLAVRHLGDESVQIRMSAHDPALSFQSKGRWECFFFDPIESSLR